eukprot:1151141-Pelagomonas_calceolata.AAC.5
MVLTFPAWPLQAPGTAPVDTNLISILSWMPLLGPGPRGAHSGDFQSTCGPLQLADEPRDLLNLTCNRILNHVLTMV